MDGIVTIYFEDGFETGDFTGWSGQAGTIVVGSGSAHHGTYFCTSTLKAEFSYGYTYKYLGVGYATMYGRCYVRITGSKPAAWAGLGIHYGDHASTTIGYVIVDCANNKWGYRILNTALTNYWEAASTMTINLNQWYCVEFLVEIGAAGTVTLWIDGTQVLTGTYDDDANGNIQEIGSRPYLSALEAANVVFDGDCFKYSDSPIGTEPSSVMKRRLLMGVGL